MQSGISQTIAGPALHRHRSASPSRAILALALAVLTGLTLGQLSLPGGNLIEQSPPRSTQATQTGVDFYDAVDAYLATGQTATLRRLLHPDIVNHSDGQPATTGIEAFLDRIAGIINDGAVAVMVGIASSARSTTFTSTSATGRFAIGRPYRASVDRHCATCFGLRQPASFAAMKASVA